MGIAYQKSLTRNLNRSEWSTIMIKITSEIPKRIQTYSMYYTVFMR